MVSERRDAMRNFLLNNVLAILLAELIWAVAVYMINLKINHSARQEELIPHRALISEKMK